VAIGILNLHDQSPYATCAGGIVSHFLTDAERERIKELYDAGMGRNEIAAAIGRSAGIVTKIARELGLSFNRAMTAEAVEARRIDMAARRAVLADNLLSDAEALREQMWEPCKYWEWGGRSHTYAEVTVEEPTPTDKWRLMSAATTASQGSMKIELHDVGQNVDNAKSMLSALAAGLQAVAESINDES
jgi:hypothetical protein